METYLSFEKTELFRGSIGASLHAAFFEVQEISVQHERRLMMGEKSFSLTMTEKHFRLEHTGKSDPGSRRYIDHFKDNDALTP